MTIKKSLIEMLSKYPLDDLKQAFSFLNVDAPLTPRGARRTTVTHLSQEIAKSESNTPQRVIDVLVAIGYDITEADVPEDLLPHVSVMNSSASAVTDEWGEAFSDEQNRLLTQTFIDYDEQIDRVKYEASGLAIQAANQAVEAMRPKADHFTVKLPRKAQKAIKGHPPKGFDTMLQLGAMRKEIRLVGPTGCGKTTVASMLAEALDLRFTALSMNEGASESHLRGRLLPMGDAGKFVYVQTDFVDFFENGGLVLLDEFDASDPNVLLVLNSALANGYMSLPEREKKPMAHRHKDFVCMVTCNTAGAGSDLQYTARNALDEATLDRFRLGTLFLDYDADVEQAVVHPSVLQWGRQTRERMASMDMQRNLSTRFMCELTDMVALGSPWDQPSHWRELLTADWSEDEKSRLY